MCMPLLRLSEEDWLAEVTPLIYDIKSSHESRAVDVPRSSVLNIIKIIEKNPAKSQILLYGEAGAGKSTTLNELCTFWKKRIGLTRRFAHAYLISVRNIVSPYASLEHIICQDLEMVPEHEEQSVRRFIKFNSASIIWFVDGYDEKTSHGKKETTIDKLISGKVALRSTVFVTSRPADVNILSFIMKNKTLEIHVKGFDDSGVKGYLKKLPKDWAPSYRDLVVKSSIPRELLRSPLIVAMVCYIHKQANNGSQQNMQDIMKLVSTRSVLDAACGVFLAIKEEKTKGCELSHYTGYRDELLTEKIKGFIRTMTKFAFQAIKMGKYDIPIEKLNRKNLYEVDLKNIGFFNLKKSNYSFIHPLFQEHAAAYHMEDSGDDLNHGLALLEKPGLMTTKLGVFSNPLLFVVGIKSSVLTLIGDTAKELSVANVKQEGEATFNCNNRDLELSFQARLFHECHDSDIKNVYLDKMKQYRTPVDPVTLSHQPQIQASAYITLVDALGLDGCLHLLKRVHQDAMIMMM